MSRNRMKIVSNQNSKSLAYYLMNEQGHWNLVSKYSELSRQKYTSAKLSEQGTEILSVIARDYNVGGRGVSIQFEGSKEEFRHLQQCIERLFPNQEILCEHQNSVIVVSGKLKTGKSILIEGMCNSTGDSPNVIIHETFTEYSTENSHVTWYETKGIDLGKENVKAAKHTISQLAECGMTSFIYCLSSDKIEKLEESLLDYIQQNYPSVKILVVLTLSLDDESTIYANQLSQHLNGIRVIPVLAKAYKTKYGQIEAYGLDEVSKYLFEGR